MDSENSRSWNIKIVPSSEAVEVKAPTPVDAIPQERFTGDVMRGYGPRRGNLERLLRYWRPIMRKPGGFRRCRVILADHPELYPLNNICAWLHHETTGLWPNEGCHHPGMKNCKKKIRGIANGSIWNDNEFNARLAKLRSRGGRKMLETSGIKSYDEPFEPVITEDDMSHAIKVLSDFIEMEPNFIKALNDDKNWEHEHGFIVVNGQKVNYEDSHLFGT
jgi:hypothetical protein